MIVLLAAAMVLTQASAPAPDGVRPAPPATSASQIWNDPAAPGTPEAAALRRAGYVREEWFQTGTADVYGYDTAGGTRVERTGLPYTTRLIVIRPRDPRRFSGTVQLNPAHPMMANANWGTIADYVLAHGDAYVGVMIGADDNTRRAPPAAVPVMAPRMFAWFDAVRYAPIAWPDEDGIRWDVFADTARLIRERAGLLPGMRVARVFASGWSFTGSFLRTFVNAGFHDRARTPAGRPLIDGYLIGISSFSFRSGAVPINAGAPNLALDDPRRPNRAVDVPVIELQSENEAITNREPQTADRDRGPGAHRLYEVPGTTHSSGGRRSDVALRQIAARTGRPYAADVDGCSFPPTDIDIAAFARAAHANLERWALGGPPPPRAARLQHDAGVQRRDADGNVVGGIRPAQIAVPLARYGAAPTGSGCDAPRAGLGSPMLPMRRVPFDRARLRALYPGGASDYLRRFDRAVEALVAERWLLPADARIQKAQARRDAAQAFR